MTLGDQLFDKLPEPLDDNDLKSHLFLFLVIRLNFLS